MTDYSKPESRYDLIITDPSAGHVFGFNFPADRPISESFIEMDSKHLVDLFASDTPIQTNTNPELKLLVGQNDFRSGFGLEVQDLKDPKRYHVTSGMDLRFKGRGILGWNSAGIAPKATGLDNAYTITNPGFESSTVTWTGGGIARSSTQAKYGTYSGKHTADNSTQTTQQSITWNDEYQGKEFTFRAFVYRSQDKADGSRVGIDDGVSAATYSSYVTAATTWTSVSVTKTLDASATELTLILETKENGVQSTDAYWDGCTLTATVGIDGTAVKHAEFNDKLYIAMGTHLVHLNSGGTGWTAVKSNFPAVITDLVPFQVSGVDYLLIFLGKDDIPYWYMTTAEAFTESISLYCTQQFGAWVNTTADTMYANDEDNKIRSTTNPLTSSTWSAQTVVGAGADTITHLQEKDGALLIDKEDMPYYLDSSGNVQKDLAPECISGKATHSGKNSTLWGGIYYRPTGDQALLASGKYSDGSIGYNAWVQPSKFGTDIGDFSGQVEAVVGDEEWLYVAVDNGASVEILCTRLEEIDGTVRRVYHPIHKLTLTGVETMWISTVVSKRLWITSTDSSESIYYLPLPTEYGDIVNDSVATFKTGGTFETPWLHGGFPSENKSWTDLTLTMGHTYNANDYFNVKYKLLGGSWSSAVKFDGSSSSMIENNDLATSTTSRTSPMIKLQFTGVTGATSRTPILLDWVLRGILYPSDVNRVYLIRVVVAENALDNAGHSGADYYTLKKTCLENMRAATSWITIKHYMDSLSGTTKYVKLLPLPQSPDWAWRKPLKKEKNKVVEWLYTLLLLDTGVT